MRALRLQWLILVRVVKSIFGTDNLITSINTTSLGRNLLQSHLGSRWSRGVFRVPLIASGLTLAIVLALIFPTTKLFAQNNAIRDMLASRVAALRAEIQGLDDEIARLDRQIPLTEDQIVALTKELGAIRIPDPQEEIEEKPDDKPRQVAFRPPQLREVDKKTPVILVCKDGVVTIIDLEEQDAAFEQILDDEAQLQDLLKAGATLPAGDYEIEMSILTAGSRILGIKRKVVPRAGKRGESRDAILKTSSNLRKRLKLTVPEECVIQIYVYPDSFDVFRDVRSKILWPQKFGVNWFPKSHNETMSIGSGTASES